MDLTLPLYRQLSGRLLLLLLCVVLSGSIGVAIYFYQAQQLDVFSTEQLPEINKYNQRQILLINNERLINTMVASKTATEFSGNYRTLADNLKKLLPLKSENRQLLEKLSQRLHLQAENVIRLTDSHRRNIQLKNNVIIQLTLVTDSLSVFISKQTLQQNSLYQQITSDQLSDRITAVRAKALSSIVVNLNQNRELHRLLVSCLAMFNHLDLQYNLREFDFLQQQTNLALEQWLLNVSEISNKSSDDKILQAQINVLSDLLFTGQNTFAKWHGQLRRVEGFRAELLAQKIALTPLLMTVSPPVEPQPTTLAQQLQHWFAKANITIAEKNYIWLVLAIFAALVLVCIFLLVSMRSKLRRIGNQSTEIIAEYANKGEVSGVPPTQEIADILLAFKQLSRPKYNESDYLNLKQQHQLNALSMSQHSGHVFWQLPKTLPQQSQSLGSLLAINETVKHWRHLFSRSEFKIILEAAKAAKSAKRIQRLSLISVQEKAISLTIEYRNNNWFGSVCLTEELQSLRDAKIQLQQQLQQQEQSAKLETITSSENTIKVIENILLQRKLSSATQQNFSKNEEQSLQSLVSLCQQQKISAQLRLDDFLLALSTVNIVDEIHTAVMNVTALESNRNNALYVNIDKNLNTSITLESELFQAMIYEVCQILLANQQHATLDISLKVIDVSSAQQMVRCSFLVSNILNHKELVQSADHLAHITDVNSENSVSNFAYLSDLMLVFSVTNKESQTLDKTVKFAFDMPLVVAAESTTDNSVVKLAHKDILVIATDEHNRKRICQSLELTQANIETMQDLTMFQRQLTVKHLTSNKLDALVVSSEVYSSDYDLIAQHVETLPEALQPKVLVIQPLINKHIAHTGLFSQCMLPWYENKLASNLEQLLLGDNRSNLLIDRDVFGQYHFLPTNVEVLLAVAKPSAHQFLIQLLSWLGLRVTLVSQKITLEQRWKTGQYLLVISEFLPFDIEIPGPVSCTRGVFYLSNQRQVPKEFIASLTKEKSWQKGNMPPTLDIQAIIKLLSPWLKPTLGHIKSQSNAMKTTQENTAENSTVESNTLAPENELLQAEDNITQRVKEAIDVSQSLDFLESTAFEKQQCTELFDLTKYAQNQGSAELAAFMLDEYLMDIEQQLSQLEKWFNESDLLLAQQCLECIIHLAGVIAAEPLLVQCQKCKEILANVNADNALSLKQNKQVQQQLVQLKLCHAQLFEFAESI